MPFGIPQNNLSQFASEYSAANPQASGMGPQFQAPAPESGQANSWAQNLVSTNGNPQGGVFGQPGAFGNPSASSTPAPTNPFANPTFQTDLGGYNPSQYATTDTANNLAQQLGGSVNQTRNAPGSPIGPPPQNMIDFGGVDMLNAGLLAERYAKYDRATADAMTRAELAQMGPRQSPNADSEGGTLGSWSQYQPVSGGQNFLGQGANMGSAIGSTARQPQVGGTSPGFNPYLPTQMGSGGYFNPELRNGGGPLPFNPHTRGPEMASNPNPNMWASRYSGYRIPYGNRRYYPGMGAAPRFQPRRDFFQPQPQMPFAWY